MKKAIALVLLWWAAPLQALGSSNFALETVGGEGILVSRYFSDTVEAPVIIWLTEGYKDRLTFQVLTQKLQLAGFQY